MNLVIGSGPAGVASAVRLIKSGLPVTLVDGGSRLDEQTATLVSDMAHRGKHQWTDQQLAAAKANVDASADGVKVKKLFGSDFVFRDVEDVLPSDSINLGHLTQTLAVGGFSNIWGAAVLPFHQGDFHSWPLGAEDFAPHYRAVSEYMPIAAQSDRLESVFPLYTDNPRVVRRSRQATSLSGALEGRADFLEQQGIIFGGPRLAMRGLDASVRTDSGFRTSCSYCGLCLFGCPYGHIWSSNETLEWLQEQPLFRYCPGAVAQELEEASDHVVVKGRWQSDRSRVSFKASRVFLAAGVLGTARILLNSLRMFDQPVTLKASEYFIVPLLSLRNFSRVESEELHTLCQMFIECFNPAIGKHSAHLQLYTFSEHFRLGLRQSLRWLRYVLPALESQILGRLMVIQGYLHSDVSSSIELRLMDGPSGPRLRITGRRNSIACATIRQLLRLLRSALRPCGVFPVEAMLNIGLPGDGRHVGGSFPMGTPAELGGSDLLGRPLGLKRVHIVDASNFPTVPASTITFSVMANADRIAREVGVS